VRIAGLYVWPYNLKVAQCGASINKYRVKLTCKTKTPFSVHILNRAGKKPPAWSPSTSAMKNLEKTMSRDRTAGRSGASVRGNQRQRPDTANMSAAGDRHTQHAHLVNDGPSRGHDRPPFTATYNSYMNIYVAGSRRGAQQGHTTTRLRMTGQTTPAYAKLIQHYDRVQSLGAKQWTLSADILSSPPLLLLTLTYFSRSQKVKLLYTAGLALVEQAASTSAVYSSSESSSSSLNPSRVILPTDTFTSRIIPRRIHNYNLAAKVIHS